MRRRGTISLQRPRPIRKAELPHDDLIENEKEHDMERVRIGVVGCGAIAQVHHMPNLADLDDRYQIQCVCDVSAGAAQYVATKYGVPRWVTDHRDLLACDVDAVLLCHSDPKTEAALDVLNAGKHLFIEKPVCFATQELEAMLEAQDRSGVVAQAGYMKVFDPAFEEAQRRLKDKDAVRFVQINHLHPNNALHLRQFDLRRYDDVPQAAMDKVAEVRRAARHMAIGDAPLHVERAFHLLAGSMIHDLYGLRTLMGLPASVASTDIWLDGRAVTFVLAYPSGARAVCTWIDLPHLWDFRETLELFADDARLTVSYPTGFARGVPSRLVVQGIDADGITYRSEPALDWETAFRRELRHFADCILNGDSCRTPLSSARGDVKLIIDIAKAYQESHS